MIGDECDVVDCKNVAQYEIYDLDHRDYFFVCENCLKTLENVEVVQE